MKKTILSLMLVSSSIFAMEGKTMTVYKSPYCGCCEKWIDIMKKEGFEVKTIDTNEVNDIKQKAGLQAGQTSCHTAFVDGYIIEGHVNYSAIKKIIQYRICSKHKEDAINLQTYLSEFKQQLKDLKNLFNI